jgi:hypothetical protein
VVAGFILRSLWPSPAAAWVAGLVFVAAAVIACSARKDLWLLAQPGAAAGTLDVWIAGTSTRGATDFAAEFACLVGEAAGLQEMLATAPPPATNAADGDDAGQMRHA